MTKARDIASAAPAPAGVTSTELGYVDGVTSALQTQIDSKIGSAAAISPTIVDAKGDIIAATAADTVSRLAVGANNTVLTADSTTATGLKWAAAGGAGALTYVGGTTFTTAGSTSIDNVFTSTYQNYLVLLNIYTGTGVLTMNFRASGSDNTTANYNFYTDYMAFSTTWSRSIVNNANATSMTLNQGLDNSNVNIPFTIQNPQLAQKTQVSSPMTSYNYNTTANYTGLNTGFFNATTQFDGIKFGITTSMTGTLKVYGIANS